MRYLILAQSECTASALGAWLELLGGEPPKEGNGNPIVIDSTQRGRDGGLDVYHSVAERMERAFNHLPIVQHGDIVVLVDSVKLSDLSAVSEGMGWDHLVALLILTFPEVKWVFGIIMGDSPVLLREDHSLASLITKTRRDPIFDPTGLREWVRARTNEKLVDLHNKSGEAGQTVALQLPIRREANLAAALDDEVDYATIHAYTAYRYGYRADILTTWALMKERFGSDRAKRLPPSESHGYRLLLEDMRLTFADKPGYTHLSKLPAYAQGTSARQGRAHHCPLLSDDRDKSEWRILITSGQIGYDDTLVDENETYLLRKRTGSGAVCYKPLGGLCDIWTKTGLRGDGEHAQNNRGNALGFLWPPEEIMDDLHDGHGSPGKLGMVARVLVERAGLAGREASSARDWIKAALLASEAAELLGGKTPTLTLAALALKHEFEVRAECTFIGAGFHFGLDQRLKEIKAEVESVCRWFHEEKRIQAKLDAETTIINRLKLAFSEAGQLEEEERCLIKLRWLNRLMATPKGWRHLTVVHWVGWLVLAYGEWLLGSFARLITLTIAWVVGLGWAARALTKQDAVPSIHETGSQTIGWFFGGNAASDPQVAFEKIQIFGDPLSISIHVLSWVAVAAGVFHVGILVSYLYSLISRK